MFCSLGEYFLNEKYTKGISTNSKKLAGISVAIKLSGTAVTAFTCQSCLTDTV